MRRFGGVLLALSLVLAVQCPDGTPPPCGPAQPRVSRIQVAGFTVARGDTALTFLADALTDDVVTSLRSAGGVVVLTGRATRASADYQLTGRVGGSRESITISARLERPDGRVAWSATRSRLRRDLPVAANELSREMLASIGLRGGTAAAQRPVDPRVYDLVSRGRYQLSQRTATGVARSTELFRQAAAADSSSALGWAWLARALVQARRWHYAVPGIPPESTLAVMLGAADRAVELEPANPAVLVMRAYVVQDVSPGSRSVSIATLRRALALDPNMPDAWLLLGRALDESDSSGAREAHQRGVALAPDDPEYLMALGLHYVWRRDYANASRWCDSAVVMNPMRSLSRSAAAQAALWGGRLAEAAANVDAMDRLGADQDLIGSAVDVRVRLSLGDTAAARRALARMVARVDSAPPLHLTLAVADGYVAFGDSAQALAMLERFPVPIDRHFQMHLRYERGFDELRTLPRFQRLLTP